MSEEEFKRIAGVFADLKEASGRDLSGYEEFFSNSVPVSPAAVNPGYPHLPDIKWNGIAMVVGNKWVDVTSRITHVRKTQQMDVPLVGSLGAATKFARGIVRQTLMIHAQMSIGQYDMLYTGYQARGLPLHIALDMPDACGFMVGEIMIHEINAEIDSDQCLTAMIDAEFVGRPPEFHTYF